MQATQKHFYHVFLTKKMLEILKKYFFKANNVNNKPYFSFNSLKLLLYISFDIIKKNEQTRQKNYICK